MKTRREFLIKGAMIIMTAEILNAQSTLGQVLFCAHGSPMNIIENNDYTRAMQELSNNIKKPKNVLIITAHWVQNNFTVSDNPELIYDFYGFPNELYKVKYNTKGDSELAQLIRNNFGANYDTSRGLDHSSWAVAMKLFPKADVKIAQLSVNKNTNFWQHYEFGKKLRSLRENGTMIIASGNLTHNLYEASFDNVKNEAWALECEKNILDNIKNKNINSLCEPYENIANFKRAHPTTEHYLPMLVALGAVNENEEIKLLKCKMQNGSISMSGFYTDC